MTANPQRSAWHVRALALLLVLGPIASAARAADGDTLWSQDRGFRLGFHLQGNGISAVRPEVERDSNDLYLDDGGGGMSFLLGYTFSPLFSLCATMGGAAHETSSADVEAYYSSFFIEAQFRFLHTERVRPYLLVGLGGVALTVDGGGYDCETGGGGMVFGGGLLWNLTHHLMLDAALRLEALEWDQIKLTRDLPGGGQIQAPDPIDEDGGAGQLQVGLTWAF